MENFGQYRDPGNGSPAKRHSLIWHRLLTWFFLWAGAVTELSMAIVLLSEQYYGNETAQVYAEFETLRIADTVMGAVMLLLAVYRVYVRFQLSGFKLGAPDKLSAVYVAEAAVSIGYTIAAAAIRRQPFSNYSTDLIAMAIICCVPLQINRSYYNKRLELFVN